MNENHNITTPRRQDTAKNLALFTGGVITTLVIAVGAQRLGYASIKLGRQTNPFEQLKEPAAAIGLSVLKYCQENIEAKDIVQSITKIISKH